MSSYEKTTVRSIIEDINSRRMYLPAIQRKYVWDEKQITTLMDSIMMEYPIGTFLFWKVKKAVINSMEYSMYEFIKDFHERDAYKNPSAPHPFPAEGSTDSIFAVLDGQQRLTSLYIALQGTLSKKLPMKRWANDDAFPKKELFFNLRSERQSLDDDVTYEFAFLTSEAAENQKDGKLWYKVKNIMKYASQSDVMMDVVNENDWNKDKIVMHNILHLHEVLVQNEIINYYQVDEDSIDKVLDIFVRVNSGGTVLSKSNLLFSTVVSHWDKARDEIDDLLAIINRKGEGFRFSVDFIMRSCLYLTNCLTTLKLSSFGKDNVLEIRSNWEKIKAAIIRAVDMLVEFGFNSENLQSYVAVMPITYYLYYGGTDNLETQKELQKYLVIAQLKQIFGASNNTALQSIREKLKDKKQFKLSDLQSIRFAGDRNLRYTDEEITALFDREYGAYTFMLLTLLYPNLKFSQKAFHQDHMHPYSGFTAVKLAKIELPDGNHLNQDKINEWQYKRNTLANLQLLEGRDNGQKNSTPLIEWLKTPANKSNVKYLPEGISYELGNFDEFMNKRQELMETELRKILM